MEKREEEEEKRVLVESSSCKKRRRGDFEDGTVDNNEVAKEGKTANLMMEQMESGREIIIKRNVAGVERSKKSSAEWDGISHTIDVIMLRGNFWKTMGHTENKLNKLYLEEALFLLEKGQLVIFKKPNPSGILSVTDCNLHEDSPPLSLRNVYEEITGVISLECYLAFVKLKSLDYVVRRCGDNIRSWNEENDVLESFRRYLQEYRKQDNDKEEFNLLRFMSSFDIYLPGKEYSKRNAAASIVQPVAHVIVTSCSKLYSSRLILTLLKQSGSIPCIFAIVTMHCGHVVLEEFTDASISLSWDFGTMKKDTDEYSDDLHKYNNKSGDSLAHKDNADGLKAHNKNDIERVI